MPSKTIQKRVAVVVGLGFFVYGMHTSGQGNSQNNVTASPAVFQRDAFPVQLKSVIDALGTRMVRPGNERIVAKGTLTKGAQPARITVTQELPNKLRIDNTSPGSARTIAFDGAAPWASD